MMGNWDSYRDDLDTLKIELEKLFEVRNDVMSRVRIAEEEEEQMMKPTTDEVVQLWLSNVQALETEVDDLIGQISQVIEELHPGGFCSRNLLNVPSSYEFEDIVAEKLLAVMNLIKEGDSVVADDEARVVTIPKDEGVAENLPEDVLYDEGTIVGMESIFTKVWRCIEEGGGGYVGIIGLYGMGGVGKTTLLKQIYRNMLDNYGQNNFAVVIWVSVSKELRLEKIQEKIGMKIGLFDKVWKNKNFEEKASDILEVLKEKKFLLLMDELWERVDLTKVGVPFPNPENSSKIVFTTRSLEICRLMEADRQFKINCLADEEAWELFKASVGDETLHSHPEQVVDIARDISKECSGLPLALASIGRALAGNKTPQEWRDVLGVLTRRSRSTSSISGSDDQVKKDIYYNLKSSYDHLQNDMFKSCLLYCCLFPRNDKISKGHLIDCWIGEGFLDDRLGAKSQGYHIIDVLLSACLLEEEEEDGNYVKMHNWIHDMTSWIATEIEEEKRNFFVCADADLTEPPEIEKWVNMTRISMTKNGFTNLENAPMCSHLQTLFLNKNKIEMIGGDFFRFMPCLKVLNLSDNPLQELPSEISNLVSLEHLDLSHTAIKSLPKQLGALKKLKCLNLEHTSELCAIPPRLISTLSLLHVLRLQGCGFLDQSGEDSVVCKDAQLLIEELFCLKNLSMLSLGLRNSHALQRLLSSYRLQSCIQSLWLHSLQHPKSIVISISYMNHLKTLRISECEYLEELEVDFVGEAQAQGISNFYFLDKVIIESCPNLRDLTWLILAPNLKHLEISQCPELEEIIKVWKLSECLELMRNLTPFLKLQILKLSSLPNLRSIYWCDLPFPDLKEGTIAECPKLQISLPPHRFNKDHSKEKITANVSSGPSSFNRKQVDPTGSDDVCGSTITDLSTGSVPFLFSKETKDGEDDMETDEVHQVMEQKLSLEETAFPISSKGRRPPGRPGYGTMGKKCIVKANHFLVQVVDRDIHHYDVSITPKIMSKKVNRDVVSELTRLYRESHLGKRMPAYDGRKSLYTAGPLPFELKEFVVKLDQDSGATSSTSKRKECKFNVTIKLASKPDLYALQQFLRSRHLDAPYEVTQVLDIVLRASPSEKYVPVGRSFFSPDLGPMGQLGDGIEYWRGFYQSLRPTQMGLSFNIDVSARGFYEPILVSEFVSTYINPNISTPLSVHDRGKVRKSFKGIKVVLTHMGYAKSYKITGISSQPLKQLMFTLEDKVTKTSVVQYFRDKYQIVLKYTSLPALQAGSDANPIYLPMELSKIVEGQRYTKRLNERQVTALLRATCQRPHERESNIKRMVLSNDYNRDKLAYEEFGIHVGGELASVDARVLPPPMLNYHEDGREAKVNPSLGMWNMINKKMINGGRVDFWTCVCFSTCVNRDLPFQFCGELVNMCNSKGMVFNPNPVIPIFSAGPNQIENALIDIHTRSTAEIARRGGKLLQLLIIILPDATGSYGRIKRVCETELGIVSQCCQPREASKLSKQYFENVALKINVKVGGRNSVLNEAVMRRLPHVSDSPTIIIGADVTHPQPGEDSSPSIAAVVASMDWPEFSKYRALVSAQGHRDEIIKDLYTSTQDAQRGVVHGGMIRDQLMAFRRSTGQKPCKIIFYRDGVSEGQFNQVLLHEVDAIRHACSSLQPNYVPPITFIVVQKRHHTRLFPSDRNMTDRSGNIQPGTVVDTKICHPTQFDFYLNSHAGIQGTSRPTHYHVLFDENGFTADELQKLTNDLCYTYARCTRSVSIVPPAYYAHLAAFRARYYIEGDTSDGGSSSGRGSGTREGHLLVKPLPGIKENVKDVMFFC